MNAYDQLTVALVKLDTAAKRLKEISMTVEQTVTSIDTSIKKSEGVKIKTPKYHLVHSNNGSVN